MTTPRSADAMDGFHPAVTAWFRGAFAGPTEAQRQAWPPIRDGRPTLVAAPTGSGKTLTAFLAAIDVLPARLRDYSGSWLDDLCRTGKVVWTRIERPKRANGGASGSAGGGPVRTTAIVLLPRRNLNLWNALPHLDAPPEISARAKRVHDALLRDGAMFFDELLGDTRLLQTELENALGELVANGLVNADSFAGLRTLLLPAAKRAIHARRRRQGRATPASMEETGRWAPVRRADTNVNQGESATSARKPRTDPQILEHIARALLRRYGVVFWRLLEREAGWLPPWRELLPILHRLEARGELRGGRFVAGLAGEQFALPEAIPLLREVRRRPADGSLVCISGVDPLNRQERCYPATKFQHWQVIESRFWMAFRSPR